MKKKLLAMTLASAMCVGMLAGCGGGSSASTDSGDSGASSSGDAYNISVIVKLTDGHFNKVMAGAKAYADEHDNVNVDIQSPTSATSYDEQVNMIETSLGNPSIDALVLAPLQSDSASTLVANTDKVVIALDTDFTSDKKLAFVGTGNKDAAKSGAVAAVEAAKAKGIDKPTVLVVTRTSRRRLSLQAYRATRPTRHVWQATRKALKKQVARSLRCSTAMVWLRRLQLQWNPLCRCIRTALTSCFPPMTTWR